MEERWTPGDFTSIRTLTPINATITPFNANVTPFNALPIIHEDILSGEATKTSRLQLVGQTFTASRILSYKALIWGMTE